MIRVFEPAIEERDIEAVCAALRNGELSGSAGASLHDFEAGFSKIAGCRFGIATTSGTSALHLAVAAAGIGGGDEVLVSASTNIATALAVLHNGATPVPVDSEALTWNLDVDLIESLITPRTRAIIPVHLLGHPVDMDRLMAIANRHDLLVIEDCAQAHGAQCRGRPVGSFGNMACFSFYANKSITTGEGGMVTTSDEKWASQLRLLRNVAFGLPRFRHDQAGFNFRMTSYQAALGLSQLGRLDSIIEAKRNLARRYRARLNGVGNLQLHDEQPWAFHVHWMIGMCVLPGSRSTRDQLAARLLDAGIDTRTFFCPMNQQPCLAKLPDFRASACPVADSMWETGLYLPSTPTLTDDQLDFICDTVRAEV